MRGPRHRVGWSSVCPSHSVLLAGVGGSCFPGRGCGLAVYAKTEPRVVGLPLAADTTGSRSQTPCAIPLILVTSQLGAATGSSASQRDERKQGSLRVPENLCCRVTSFFFLMEHTQTW